MEQVIRLNFLATNNKAEYEAIVLRLDLALTVQTTKVKIQSDSQLVVAQIQNGYEANDGRMVSYLTVVRSQLAKLEEWEISQILREQNAQVDALARIAATLLIRQMVLLPLYIKTSPTLDILVIHEAVKALQDWMEPIKAYIEKGSVPNDVKLAHKLRVQATRYALVDGQLYKRSFGGPYLKCLSKSEAQYVLAELHERICGNHPGGRTLAHRAHSPRILLANDEKRRSRICQEMRAVSEACLDPLVALKSPPSCH